MGRRSTQLEVYFTEFERPNPLAGINSKKNPVLLRSD